MGRPSIDPELMIRMLVVGYIFAIRSKRSICREVQVNLAYRWFRRLGIEDVIPDHSAFSRARNERFREGVSRKQAISDIVRVASRIASTIALDLAPGAADVLADGASLFALRATHCPDN
jgi:transposase